MVPHELQVEVFISAWWWHIGQETESENSMREGIDCLWCYDRDHCYYRALTASYHWVSMNNAGIKAKFTLNRSKRFACVENWWDLIVDYVDGDLLWFVARNRPVFLQCAFRGEKSTAYLSFVDQYHFFYWSAKEGVSMEMNSFAHGSRLRYTRLWKFGLTLWYY